jgi:CPA2 family monovalent cation:H+ antiporter-2
VLTETLVLLGLSLAAAWALRRLNLPPILGYLVVGALAGPHALGWLPPHGAEDEILSEGAVVLLLFTIGLEVSIPHLLAMRREVLGVGAGQVTLSAALGALIGWVLGMSWQAAVVVGGALAMSSTALVMKQLRDQLEVQSRHGRAALAVLLFQDLAVVPLLVAIPILAGGPEASVAGPLGLAVLKGAVALVLMLAVGRWLMRPALHAVAAAHSAEIFTLASLLMALTAAWLTSLAGLSLALGAFLAGMMLGGTEYRHQIEADVRPFRDVLIAFFFVMVGANLDVAALPRDWDRVLVWLAVLMLGKGLIVTVLVRLAGHESGVALRTGLVLAQGGEFAFALLTLALTQGVITAQESQAVLAGTVLSMVLAPVIIRFNGALAKRVCAGTYLRERQLLPRQIDDAVREVGDHVVVCGFGRIGQNLADFLRAEGIPYVALDLDPTLIREAWEAGERVFYGDSTHREILEAAGVGRARAVVVTFDDAPTAIRIIGSARALSPTIPVVVRTRDDTWLEELERAGASVVVPEAVEASMTLATHLLQRLGVPLEEVLHLVEESRHDHYRRLRGVFRGVEPASVAQADPFRLHTVVLTPESAAVGRTLAEVGVVDGGTSVYAVRRGAIRGEAPSPEMALRAGDAVVLQGPPEELALAEERLLRGARGAVP